MCIWIVIIGRETDHKFAYVNMPILSRQDDHDVMSCRLNKMIERATGTTIHSTSAISETTSAGFVARSGAAYPIDILPRTSLP